MLDYNLLVAFRAGKEEEAEDEMVKRARDAGAEIEDWNVSAAPYRRLFVWPNIFQMFLLTPYAGRRSMSGSMRKKK